MQKALTCVCLAYRCLPQQATVARIKDYFADLLKVASELRQLRLNIAWAALGGMAGALTIGSLEPPQKRQHRSRKTIVAISCHHVSRTPDIDVIGVRHQFEKLFGVCFLHKFGRCAADEQSRNPNPARGSNQ